jgi:hypothetical protein
MNNKIFVECADITDFDCDVLVLKYAQAFYGADGLVADLLAGLPNPPDISPLPGQYVLLPSMRRLEAAKVLFIGVSNLYQFDYEKIREFARYSLQILSKKMPDVRHIAMTMHGVGYGLDEREAFLAQIAGLFDAIIQNGLELTSLERITIVERNHGRAKRLKTVLQETLQANLTTKIESSDTPKPRIDAGQKSDSKPHIFVAMPFTEDMEDTYIFGIQGPVNSAGYLCERIDMTTFTGDILARIKSRIETANLIIADLTGGNANVYLEVGYAWGKERPTLLLAKKGDKLHFEVRGQRCIIYKNIAELKKQLEIDLAALSEEKP